MMGRMRTDHGETWSKLIFVNQGSLARGSDVFPRGDNSSPNTDAASPVPGLAALVLAIVLLLAGGIVAARRLSA